MAQPKSSINKPAKAPSALETEELIELLEQGQVEEQESPAPQNYDKDDILGFIAAFNIEPGEEQIKQHTLYLIYTVWSKNPIIKSSFYTKMGRYFQTNGTKCFGINQSAIKLTHEAYLAASKVKRKSKQTINHKYAEKFETFLKFHSLERGNYWLSLPALKFIYDKYCAVTGIDLVPTKKLGIKLFDHYAKIYLEEKETIHGIKYGLSDNVRNFLKIEELAKIEADTIVIKKKRGWKKGVKRGKKEKKPKKRSRKS